MITTLPVPIVYMHHDVSTVVNTQLTMLSHYAVISDLTSLIVVFQPLSLHFRRC